MRIAFEQRLQVQVNNAIEFLSETGGPQAVARVREAGMDRFEVRTFKKLDCAPDNDGFRCNFEVDVIARRRDRSARRFLAGSVRGQTAV